MISSGGAAAPAEVLDYDKVEEPIELASIEVSFSQAVEQALSAKTAKHNAECAHQATDDMIRSVYRRGALAFPASDKPTISRDSWAMARVDAFMYLLKNGAPRNPTYTTDYDLLPDGHPKCLEMDRPLTASGMVDYEPALTVSLKAEHEYETQEHAVLALAEFSGLGYEIVPALRAAWIRGVAAGENPYERATLLASALYKSPDADLLPKEGSF